MSISLTRVVDHVSGWRKVRLSSPQGAANWKAMGPADTALEEAVAAIDDSGESADVQRQRLGQGAMSWLAVAAASVGAPPVFPTVFQRLGLYD